MDKKLYMAEVSAKLGRFFNTTKEGHKPPLSDKHRCEGFMQAGVFLGIATNKGNNYYEQSQERYPASHPLSKWTFL